MIPYSRRNGHPTFCQELVALAKHRGVKANGKKASTDFAFGAFVLVAPGEEICFIQRCLSVGPCQVWSATEMTEMPDKVRNVWTLLSVIQWCHDAGNPLSGGDPETPSKVWAASCQKTCNRTGIVKEFSWVLGDVGTSFLSSRFCSFS